MQPPPYECLFCRTGQRSSFTWIEHPISESLGNDDVTLEPGFVCDSCNQYFGAKLESKVLAAPPFNVERARQAIPTKKGKPPRYDGDGFSLVSTGYRNKLFVVATTDDHRPALRMLSRQTLITSPPTGYSNLLARFMLKMGIELLAVSGEINPLSHSFDA